MIPVMSIKLLLILGVMVFVSGNSWLVAEEGLPAANGLSDSGALYESKVKSILRERCFACHGPLRQEGDLRLDTVELMKKGGSSGSVIQPGDAKASLLVQRITAEDIEQRMPPEGEGEKVPLEIVQILSQWIQNGAASPRDEKPEPGPDQHWAYQPIVVPDASALAGETVLDAMIREQWGGQQLTPNPRAAPEVLLRRLYFDLIGLPPSQAEIAQLPKDYDAAWYEATVERLLRDPRYGERWGRHWMDIWRYSDWWGLGDQLRNSQQHIWHWRDWIIESLNQDRPYDEMVRLMLAADEYKPEDLSDLRATGFLVRNYFLFNRNQWLDDTVEHVSKGFLGITMNCAKCHDHKYDPISQVDYYQMRAIFEPYHVRLDMIEGVSDLNRNSIPRVFDGWLDLPTYRFVRGDEHQPDKSKAIVPGVPSFLASSTFHVESVALPPVAWQPERRSFVRENAREIAKRNIAEAEQQGKEASDRLQIAKGELQTQVTETQSTPPQVEKWLVDEKFEQWNADVWDKLGGDWVFEPKKLSQNRDGQTRSVLKWKGEPPTDLDVRLRFAIRGGSLYRSVGISFDCTHDGSGGALKPTDRETMIYVSAHGPDPKVQASFLNNGTYQYPPDGRVPQAIELNRIYELRVQVRGDLVNASLDGVPKLAWKIPGGRHAGHLQFTTFDVLADFREIRIQSLAKTTPLRQPGSGSALDAATAYKLAELDQVAAEKKLEWRKVEWDSLAARERAWDAIWKREDLQAVPNASPQEVGAAQKVEAEARLAAIDVQNQVELANASYNVAVAEANLVRNGADKKEASEKELSKAKEGLAAAHKKRQDKQGELLGFSGARWAATRFLNSGVDDPAVSFPKQSSGRRKALAEWITSKTNPLTARVAVNHIWTRHFGEPLVANVFDFGLKGSPPTQTRLIDYLASEFIASGWSMKHLHRRIVLSEAYRRSSSLLGADENLKRDPENRFLWRRNPIRIESQAVRDSILSLAGTLDETRGGAPVMPAEQDASKRRSLYFFHSNNERNLFLQMFDEAMVKECYRREQNIIPQQALALSNSPLVLDAVPAIADRLAKNAPDEDAFICLAFEQLLGVRATTAEQTACRKAMEQWRQLPEEGLGAGSGHRDRILLVWTLINHNDFVTVR
jgi:hypothetical protein